MVEFAVAPPVDGAARELWKSLPGVDSVHEEDGLTSLSVREAHQTIPALLGAVEERGLAAGPPDHAPGEPGGRVRASDGQAFEGRIGNRERE